MMVNPFNRGNPDVPNSNLSDDIDQKSGAIDNPAHPSDINNNHDGIKTDNSQVESMENDLSTANGLEPLKDDDGNKISNDNNKLKPNSIFSIFNVEYRTDDNGEIISIDGNLVPNNTYILDGKTYYTDDNGQVYRVGNDLKPNTEYMINGYKYRTDDKGRIISAEGKLRLKEHDGRLPIKDSIDDIGKGDQQEGDDRGHLIGDQFDGSNGLENMIPQNADINRNDFKNFEIDLAKSVKEGNEVLVKIEPIYDGDSNRPNHIVVTYSINGEVSVRIFPNNSEG